MLVGARDYDEVCLHMRTRVSVAASILNVYAIPAATARVVGS